MSLLAHKTYADLTYNVPFYMMQYLQYCNVLSLMIYRIYLYFIKIKLAFSKY